MILRRDLRRAVLFRFRLFLEPPLARGVREGIEQPVALFSSLSFC